MDCLLQICKGISWSLPIVTLFLAAAWFMSFITKETVDKAMKKYAPKED